VDKESFVRGICEREEHHLWSSDSGTANRGIHTLRSSKPNLWCTAVGMEGGGLLTEESEVKARWASYFERLHQADAPAAKVDVRGVTIPIAYPPINFGPPLFVETQPAVNWLKCCKTKRISKTVHQSKLKLYHMIHDTLILCIMSVHLKPFIGGN